MMLSKPPLPNTSPSHKWLVFLSASILLLMTNIDFTAVNLALAPLARDLHFDIMSVQWVITAYLLGAASMVLLGGFLGDAYGHKKIFLLGSLIFVIVSLGVGLSDSKWSIIVMRFIQGFGSALVWPIAIVVVRKAFVSQEHLSMGLINGVMGASLSLGPPVGGVILHYLGWRWIFFINLPLGAILLLVSFFALPKDIKLQNRKKINTPSCLLLIIGLLCFIFSLSESQRLGIKSPLILATFIIGIVFLILFVILQKKITNPLLDLTLFKKKSLRSCYIIRFFVQLCWSGLYFALGLLFQNILGHSAIATGLYFLIITVTLASISPLYGVSSKFYSSRKLVMSLSLVCIICFAWLAAITNTTPIEHIWIIMFLYGLGTGIGLPVLLNVGLALAPPEKRGMASGILYEALFLGGTIGTLLASSFINLIATHYLWQQLNKLGLSFSQAINKILLSSATGVHDVYSLAKYFKPERAKMLIDLTQKSFYHALMFIGVTFVAFNILILCLAWFIKLPRREQP